MVTRKTLEDYVKTFRDEVTREILTETIERFDDKLDALIEKANSDLIEGELAKEMYINEYFVYRELLSMRMDTDLTDMKKSFEELKKDVGYQSTRKI